MNLFDAIGCVSACFLLLCIYRKKSLIELFEYSPSYLASQSNRSNPIMIKDKAFQNKHSIYVLEVNSSDHNVQVALKVASIRKNWRNFCMNGCV